jgi:hypothetical protein
MDITTQVGNLDINTQQNADGDLASVKTLASTAVPDPDVAARTSSLPDQKAPPTTKPQGLTRRLSFTGRPIDIVRNACSSMRNELCALLSK